MAVHTYVVEDRTEGLFLSSVSRPGIGAVLSLDDAGPLSDAITDWVDSGEVALVP